MPGELSEAVDRWLLATADLLVTQIETCHERVACPKCKAPIGSRCRAMPAGHRLHRFPQAVLGRELRHSHRERWSQEVPPR